MSRSDARREANPKRRRETPDHRERRARHRDDEKPNGFSARAADGQPVSSEVFPCAVSSSRSHDAMQRQFSVHSIAKSTTAKANEIVSPGNTATTASVVPAAKSTPTAFSFIGTGRQRPPNN